MSCVYMNQKVPISELRNDAGDNILGALILAGQYVIPEVSEYSIALVRTVQYNTVQYSTVQ